MPSGLQLFLVVSIGILFIVKKVLAYLRAASAIRSVSYDSATQRRTDHDIVTLDLVTIQVLVNY